MAVLVTTLAMLALAWCAFFGVRSVSAAKAMVVTTVALFGSSVVCRLWSPFGFSSEGYEYMHCHWR